ncbi:MAG: T9SS type A sorting domain-containing protein [candidate division WOR-3 bacterium]|nr:MAG: T9SS type A sorting domain-containing protein [candidate division WOR-3 bacterium]
MEDGAAIAGSAHDPRVIFTAGYIYLNSEHWFQTSVTTDRGSTWRNDTVESQRRAHAVAFDVGDPDRVYLGGDSLYGNPMFKISTDLGLTWTESHSGLSGSVAAIATVARSPSTLYCGTSQGLFKSTDAGVGWTRQGSMNAVRAVAVDTVNTDIVYAGTASGVYVSTDAGSSWNPFNDGLTSTDILSLVLRCGPGGQLFAGTNGRGMFRTEPLVGIRSGRTGGRAGAGFSLWPNPCHGRVRVCFGTGFPGAAQVRVFDAAGCLVLRETLGASPDSAELVLDLGQMPEGVYVVSIDAGRQSSRHKLVVQR